MGKTIRVPITPEVLDWAISESGYTLEQVAHKSDVSLGDLKLWLLGVGEPSLTKFRSLAKTLKRTLATFLLPRPPESASPSVQFRHPPGAQRTKPSFEERRYFREAARIQEAAQWVMHELGEPGPAIPTHSLDADVEVIGDYARQKLEPLLPTQPKDWTSHAQAFHAWRTALEAYGILVFVFPLGEESARGFSLWDDYAPLVAVNSAWNHAARIFTLFHEFGHLLTRTSSVCLERSGPKLLKPTDPAERWCEEFAATTLLPWAAVSDVLKRRFGWREGTIIADLDVPKAIANTLKVSWRAATIRLIERGVSTWSLYAQIPPVGDQKKGGGSGDGGRDRGSMWRHHAR
jgi:Zn-dependent peptidase ImmA (M78 family)/transcriptional regulator with XRE-family HTH domain